MVLRVRSGQRNPFRLTEEIADGHARSERDGTLWLAGFGFRDRIMLGRGRQGPRGRGPDRSRGRHSRTIRLATLD